MELEDVSRAFADLVIIEELPAGRQGWVFKAKTEQEEMVVLKIFDPTKTVVRRVDHEVEALRELQSPYIVTLVDEGSRRIGDVDHRYTLTQYIEGINLKTRLAQSPLSGSEGRSLGRRMAKAISDLWRRRIVHRDIKPSNIMLDTQEQAILIDLGIAKHLDRTTVTQYGKILGTEGYMSPEQARGRRALTQKSDVFGLGIVLLESMSGNHPYLGRQDRIGAEPALGLDTLSAVETELAQVVAQMLAISPIVRPSAERVFELLG